MTKPRTLVAVYSYTGNSRRLAELLRNAHDWPSGEIVELRPRRAGFVGGMRCAIDHLFRRRPAVRFDGPDPAGFDNIVLVGPIWFGRAASPLCSFAHTLQGRSGDVGVIAVMGGRSDVHRAFSDVGHALGRSPTPCAAITASDIDDGTCAARLLEFGRGLEKAASEAPPLRQAIWSSRSA